MFPSFALTESDEGERIQLTHIDFDGDDGDNDSQAYLRLARNARSYKDYFTSLHLRTSQLDLAPVSSSQESLEKDGVCMIFNSEDELWCRGRVIRKQAKLTCIRYIDDGSREMVSDADRKRLIPITSNTPSIEFWKLFMRMPLAESSVVVATLSSRIWKPSRKKFF